MHTSVTVSASQSMKETASQETVWTVFLKGEYDPLVPQRQRPRGKPNFEQLLGGLPGCFFRILSSRVGLNRVGNSTNLDLELYTAECIPQSCITSIKTRTRRAGYIKQQSLTVRRLTRLIQSVACIFSDLGVGLWADGIGQPDTEHAGAT